VAILATALAGAWHGGWLGLDWRSKGHIGDESSEEIGQDGSRPASWFANYTDKFLSENVVQFATSTAQKRNFPTSKGSTILGTLQPGEHLAGRWVEGADPATKWLKTDDGGYVWDGNLASEDMITPFGMLGMVADMSHDQIGSRLNPTGNYGSQSTDWNSINCEIYTTRTGLVDVMVQKGKATSFSTANGDLRTREGIHVGSSEAELLAAYGSRLTREENPYDGVDYYVWTRPDRGIKFAASNGMVKGISSGSKAIEYVEGCL
jgi:hypothetical protein